MGVCAEQRPGSRSGSGLVHRRHCSTGCPLSPEHVWRHLGRPAPQEQALCLCRRPGQPRRLQLQSDLCRAQLARARRRLLRNTQRERPKHGQHPYRRRPDPALPAGSGQYKRAGCHAKQLHGGDLPIRCWPGAYSGPRRVEGSEPVSEAKQRELNPVE